MPIHIKPNIKQLIDDYATHHTHPGNFLCSVLCKNLFDAVHYATQSELTNLKEICMYIHWEIPAICHGNKDKVNAWLNKKPSR